MDTTITTSNQVNNYESLSIIGILEVLEELIKNSNKMKIESTYDFHQLNIAETMGADSLDMVRFVVFLEQKFSVQLEDSAVINVQTFGELAHAIYDASKL